MEKIASGQLDLAGLLPSQAIATFVEKPRVIIAGGYGTGKSVSLCTRMAYRMARTPFNRGIILRLHAADWSLVALAQVLPGS